VADSIRLEVTATPAALPVVRMVLGGVAARVDLSLDEIDDLYVAVEQLLSAAADSGEDPHHELIIQVVGDGLTVNVGPFRSWGLRARLTAEESAGEFDLRTVMCGVVESVEVCAAPDNCYSVVFAKRRAGV
jgi:hypothetical protein